MNGFSGRLVLGAALIGLAFSATSLLGRAPVAGAAPSRQPAAATTSTHTIRVVGAAELLVSPNEAYVQLGVSGHNSAPLLAMTQNANRVSAIRAGIEGLGVAAQDIHEANAGLLYNPNNGSYQTGTILTVELDGTTVSKAGATVDAALKAGAARCASVSFGLSDDADANAQVLREALANARRQADAVATAGGVKIIGVQAITQSTNSYGGPAAAKYGPAFGGPGPQPLSCPAAGRGGYYGSPNPQIALTATVTVTYLIG